MQSVIEKSVERAQLWARKSNAMLSQKAKQEMQMFQSIVDDEQSKLVLTYLFDQAFRTENAARTADQFQYILQHYGIPQYMQGWDRFLIDLFLLFGRVWPSLSVALIKRRIKQDTAKVILRDHPKFIRQLVELRNADKNTLNLNILGEVVLGEVEANQRLKEYKEVLQNPDVRYLSIKLSNIFSQNHPLGYKRARKILIERLSVLFRQANQVSQTTASPKFINLDMEEYKDSELTYDVFMSTLSLPEFQHYQAGIVVQAYLPDAALWLEKLQHWARERVYAGGSPIKIRLVKGANLQMEQVEASLHSWECPVLPSKVLVDANFKKIIDIALQPENAPYVHLGLGSHNLFDIAYATVIAEQNSTSQYLTLEMLEGMAEGLRLALSAEQKSLVLYSPVASQTTFLQAIGYLIRRLDENSAKDNFLRYSFDLVPGSQNWQFLHQQFLQAQSLKNTIDPQPRFQQDLNQPPVQPMFALGEFKNEVETNFFLPQNRAFAEKICAQYGPSAKHTMQEIPVWVGQQEHKTGQTRDVCDSNIMDGPVLYRLHLSGKKEIDEAIAIAEKDDSNWRTSSLEHRYQLLRQVAQELRKQRGHLMGVMAQNTGKVFLEADLEITEAIDFAEYYPASLYRLQQETNARLTPKGLVLVIAPWNFPAAIPAGGVLAALATGNNVILKPASESAIVGVELAKIFWQAGIPKDVLQVVNCGRSEDLRYLSAHSAVRSIIFTGSTATAKKIIQANPTITFSAETGGKNATIVTELADHDQAVKNVIHSAFGNSGQKCSATSLLILPPSLYRSSEFKNKLLDCAESYKTGSAWDLSNFMGPIIKPPSDDLKWALDHSLAGEYWLSNPDVLADNPKMLTPSIKLGVQPGSFMHLQELFAPVLAVMEAKNLDEAIELANATEYGLTSGLESLDEREQSVWMEKIEAGNLYINRSTTGAIVQRQPFGGMKNSAFGSGLKAGGPNYVLQLGNWEETQPVTQPDQAVFTGRYAFLEQYTPLFADREQSFLNYIWRMQQIFDIKVDFAQIRGQENWFLYKKSRVIGVRVQQQDSFANLLAVALAGALTQADMAISYAPGFEVPADLLELWQSFLLLKNIRFYEQSAEDWAQSFYQFQRLRYLHPDSPTQSDFEQASVAYRPIICHEPYQDGRLELPFYLQEQSVSINYHRYGNLGERQKYYND